MIVIFHKNIYVSILNIEFKKIELTLTSIHKEFLTNLSSSVRTDYILKIKLEGLPHTLPHPNGKIF